MSNMHLTYDADGHAVAAREPGHETVALGRTHPGPEIEEFSAGDLVATGVPACMLFSMVAQARHDCPSHTREPSWLSA